MPNSIAIAIFVKTPEFSPVKTRLAASIGKDAAIQVYEYCLKIVEEKVLKLQAKLAPQIELHPTGPLLKQNPSTLLGGPTFLG